MQITQAAYALDSTTTDPCLSLFPWASFREQKGAIKLHAEMDLQGSIPCVIRISRGKGHDVIFSDQLVLEPAAFYVMDRGYVDFAQESKNLSTLSRSASMNPFLRYRRTSSPYCSNKQFCLASPDDWPALQTSMKDRVALKWIKQNLRVKGF